MKEGPNPVLGYVLGMVALIGGTVLSTGRVTTEINPLPLETVTAANQSGCVRQAMNVTSLSTYRTNTHFTTTLTSTGLQGDPLIISGTVYASDRITPLPGARIEVWHADAFGQNDSIRPFAFRGQFLADAEGNYRFSTIRSGRFRIDCRFLPAQIHYRVTYLDNPPFSTTLFFEGDPYLAEVVPSEPSAIVSLITRIGSTGPVLHATFDVILPGNSPLPASFPGLVFHF